MKWFIESPIVSVLLLTALGSFGTPAQAQVDDVQVAAKQQGESEPPKTAETSPAQETDEPESTIVVSKPLPPGNPKELRLHLWDGSVITGELSVDSITVQTEFGDLKIPVEKVVAFHPGLKSYPELSNQIDTLVDQLGADDFNTRKAAHQALSQMGLRLKHEISRFDNGGNAERKKHLEEIKQEITRMDEELDEFGETSDVRPFIQGDAVETPDFTVVGKIKQDQFQVDSKYGMLTVNLADVKMCDRQAGPAEKLSRRVNVMGNEFIQSNPKATGIRVNKGDVIKIRAEGQIVMTPWGSNRMSTPDGSPQFGSENGLPGGALTAKIGDSGSTIKVGAKHDFTAKQTGMLKLGIAMQQSYAQGNYVFPGQYRVRITVEPVSPTSE